VKSIAHVLKQLTELSRRDGFKVRKRPRSFETEENIAGMIRKQYVGVEEARSDRFRTGGYQPDRGFLRGLLRLLSPGTTGPATPRALRRELPLARRLNVGEGIWRGLRTRRGGVVDVVGGDACVAQEEDEGDASVPTPHNPSPAPTE